MTDAMVAHVGRLIQTYNGPLRNELMHALLDIGTLKARVAELEAAIKPTVEIEGKYGDKFIRVPHDVHAKLCEVMR